MTGRLNELKERLQRELSKKEVLESQLAEEQISVKKQEVFLDIATKARAVVQVVAEATQKKLEYRISNLVSMALASIWEDPYKFTLRFIQRRNKTECDLVFSKNGNETDDILNSGGGGVADIASIALQLALWSIKKSRNVMIWDEPTSFLHNPIYQEKASDLFKRLCEELQLQIIMISDQQNIIQAADKVITVEYKNGVSVPHNQS
jgi:DNA repair exonuclease SbcCD ATPase subunit